MEEDQFEAQAILTKSPDTAVALHTESHPIPTSAATDNSDRPQDGPRYGSRHGSRGPRGAPKVSECAS